MFGSEAVLDGVAGGAGFALFRAGTAHANHWNRRLNSLISRVNGRVYAGGHWSLQVQ
jgi:hypothetical protein